MNWTKQHELYLKKYYGQKSITEIANTLGRSNASIQRKAQRMNLTTLRKTESRPWTQEEIEYIEKSLQNFLQYT